VSARGDAELTAEAFDAGAAVLDELAAASAGEKTAFGTWADLARDFDLVEGALRSVRKRRTIDVHFEATSERSQFKTQMTAIGCGVLVLTLLGIIAVLIAGAALDPRNTTEIMAEAADSIVALEEFENRSPNLTPAGRKRVADIAGRARSRPGRRFPVLVEEATNADAQLNERRRQNVVKLLLDAGVDRADDAAVLAPVRGRKFGTAMRIARIAVWLPLLIFLSFQALLFVARPAPKPPAAAEDNEPGALPSSA
jgi:hypothetical protein